MGNENGNNAAKGNTKAFEEFLKNQTEATLGNLVKEFKSCKDDEGKNKKAKELLEDTNSKLVSGLIKGEDEEQWLACLSYCPSLLIHRAILDFFEEKVRSGEISGAAPAAKILEWSDPFQAVRANIPVCYNAKSGTWLEEQWREIRARQKKIHYKLNPYSYHTFLCPLLLDETGKKMLHEKLEKDQKRLKMLHEKLEKDQKRLKTDQEKLENTRLWERKQYHTDGGRDIHQVRRYFTEAAWDAMFSDTEGKNTENYVLHGSRNGVYHIEKKDPKIDIDIKLNINMIRLKVYGQVAILIFELEHYLKEEFVPEKMGDITDTVFKINDFGRRLYAPFLDDENMCSICADRLTVTFADGGEIVEELTGGGKQSVEELTGDGKQSDDCKISLPDLVRQIIFGADTANKNIDENIAKEIAGHIQMDIDERMFVCSCITDDDYVSKFRDPQNSDKLSTHAAAKKELYAIANIDSDKDGTCHNIEMLDQILEEQLYLRWIGYGTIYAVTNYSMVCITGANPGAEIAVVRPFLIQYVEMCSLVITQRAGLTSFDTRITDALADPSNKKKENALVKLENEFSEFQGRLLLSEVTKQIQGIELYNKLQSQLRIHEIEEGIRQRLSVLYELAETNQERRLNYWVTGLTIMSVASMLADAAGYFKLFMPSEDPADVCSARWALVALIAIILIMVFFFFCKYRPIGRIPCRKRKKLGGSKR